MNLGVSSSIAWLVDKLTMRELSERELASLLEDFKLNLARNDVAWELAEQMAARMSEALVGSKVERFGADVRTLLISTLRCYLLEVLPTQEVDLLDLPRPQDGEVLILMFIGANGSGKSTTLAKFAYRYKLASLKPMVVCADTFRAGAVEQLGAHASKLGAHFVHGERGDDPAAVAYDAVEEAKEMGSGVVLIDTAGRLQTDVNLMDELSKVKKVVQPSHVLLVVDALIGNDAWEQARMFGDPVGFDSSVIAKFDADPKGGVAISVSFASGRPVSYVGTGQGYGDLKKFSMRGYIDELTKSL